MSGLLHFVQEVLGLMYTNHYIPIKHASILNYSRCVIYTIIVVHRCEHFCIHRSKTEKNIADRRFRQLKPTNNRISVTHNRRSLQPVILISGGSKEPSPGGTSPLLLVTAPDTSPLAKSSISNIRGIVPTGPQTKFLVSVTAWTFWMKI